MTARLTGTFPVDARANSPGRITPPSPLPYVSRRALARVKNPLPSPTCCNICGSSEVSLVDNASVYGRSFGDWPYIYRCDRCDAYVGLHPNTDIPLGSLADKGLREARKANKAKFFGMMKRLNLNRVQAYGWLAKALKIPVSECHWGWFDEDTCIRAGQLCAERKR